MSKATMTIISGDSLKKTLGDIQTATTKLQELADIQKARDNESVWDKIKRVASTPLYNKGE